MAEKSRYGAWESQGEAADDALQKVAGIHHHYSTARGVACLCGAYCGTNRAFTEHVIDQTVKALGSVGPAPIEVTGAMVNAGAQAMRDGQGKTSWAARTRAVLDAAFKEINR